MPDLFSSNLSTIQVDAQNKFAEGAGAVADRFGTTSTPFSKIAVDSNVIAASTTASAYGNTPTPYAQLGYTTTQATSSSSGIGVTATPYANIATVDVTAGAVNAQLNSTTANTNQDYKVSLTSQQEADEVLYFEVMPEITENRSVGYEAVSTAQSPGAFQKYKGTESTQWQLNATFVSRTTAEATQNLAYINMLRGWTMPYFGENTAVAYPNKLGAPPPVLLLDGYRSAGIVGPMPVVLTSLSWNWPRDVDYIPANEVVGMDDSDAQIPFPVVMTVAMQLVEALSTEQMNQFDLDSFKAGNMIGAFSAITSAPANANGPKTGDGAQTVEWKDLPTRDRELRATANAEGTKLLAQAKQAAAISQASVAAAAPVVVQKASTYTKPYKPYG
jgi:hypothetical protein